MLTGGAEAAMTPIGLSGFSSMKALSERNDNPPPRAALRRGSRRVCALRERRHLGVRGSSTPETRAKIYGEILGYGASADAGHITQPDENGTGAARAMSAALRDGKLAPDVIDYINAHGTSTPLGDKAETIAVKRVFESHAHKVNISSTKSQLGHLLGASGGVELIVSLMALRDQVCPPTINLDTPDPACDLNYTPNKAQERPIKYVMSNSFGFGGHNASIIAGKVQ
jgi:3-oxoacyl-[acyl-carrier-protein] synthase II